MKKSLPLKDKSCFLDNMTSVKIITTIKFNKKDIKRFLCLASKLHKQFWGGRTDGIRFYIPKQFRCCGG